MTLLGCFRNKSQYSFGSTKGPNETPKSIQKHSFIPIFPLKWICLRWKRILENYLHSDLHWKLKSAKWSFDSIEFEIIWIELKADQKWLPFLLENASKIKVLNINKQAILQWMNLKTFWLLAWHRNVGNAFTFSKKSQFYLKYNQEKR